MIAFASIHAQSLLLILLFLLSIHFLSLIILLRYINITWIRLICFTFIAVFFGLNSFHSLLCFLLLLTWSVFLLGQLLDLFRMILFINDLLIIRRLFFLKDFLEVRHFTKTMSTSRHLGEFLFLCLFFLGLFFTVCPNQIYNVLCLLFLQFREAKMLFALL